MFGRKKPEGKPTVPAFTPPKKPGPMPVRHGTQPLGTYEALANELNFQPAQLLEEQLRRFLHEEGIPTYGYTEVNDYMTALAENQGKVWIWRPLRKQDEPDGWRWDGRETDKVYAAQGHGSYCGDVWAYRPYDKVVPIHILRQVKKIQDKFGEKVLFFVSDYAVPHPDPFIMVTALDVSKIVFGVWDEPGFGTESED